MVYHACNCHVGERLYVGSLIGLLGFFVVIVIFLLAPQFGKYSSHHFLLPISVFWLAVSLTWPEVQDATRLPWWVMYTIMGILFFVLIVILCIVFNKLKRCYVIHSSLFIYCMASLVLGILLWSPEDVFNYCLIPTSQFQILHGLWHVMSSLSVFFLYCFLRSISFARVTDAILWSPAILLQSKG